MRIRFEPLSFTEFSDLDFVIGMKDDKYNVIVAATSCKTGQFEYIGEINVSGYKNMTEIKEAVSGIMNGIFETGKWDISTEKKRKLYGITIY